VFRLLRGAADLLNYRQAVLTGASEVGSGSNQIDAGLAEAFRDHLQLEPGLEERFERLAEQCRRTGRHSYAAERNRLVGELRHLLARSCVSALEPDLIILDEFQRFRDLLDTKNEIAELAQHLFAQKDARIVLLSATPYKMYTLADESLQRSEDHYADFLRTARFLIGDDGAARLADELKRFRNAILETNEIGNGQRRRARKRVEQRLRRVMTRTERLAVTSDRNGMLVERALSGLRLESSDLRSFLTADLLCRQIGAGDALEYWKSAPYLLNFMDSYKLKVKFKAALDTELQSQLAETLASGDGLLVFDRIAAYQRIDPGNARLRALIHDTLDNNAWRLLWLPPSLPYYQPGAPFDAPNLGSFTKRLVFSSWWMVPQVIATIVSYEAERRMVRAGGARAGRRKPRYDATVNPLLRFQRTVSRMSGMPLFALVYPSPRLALIGSIAACGSVARIVHPAARGRDP
jgi:hypothetical protein